MKGRIYFHSGAGTFHLQERRMLKRWIDLVFRKEGISYDTVNFVFCTDRQLLRLNKKFLNHSDLTDVITFQHSRKQPFMADIYISAERVSENAGNNEESFRDELHRVMVHGVLHLSGYRDYTKKERTAMRQREDHYLALRS